MIIAEDIQHSSGRSMKGSYGYTRHALGLVILKDYNSRYRWCSQSKDNDNVSSGKQITNCLYVFMQRVSLSKSSIMIALIMGRENDWI